MNKEVTINIKPLSVNSAFKGRRFKTKDYDIFIKNVLSMLPNNTAIDNKALLKISITFGFSSKASDLDNGLKTFIDCLVKKYGFDDRNIYEIIARKEIVKKGHEFIKYFIVTYDLDEAIEEINNYLNK
jgi:Holliday junction resolvase RusA-like endonuclease